MNKHAYLIMAHDQFDLLKKLIQLLDYEHNDLYIHIDKKIKNFSCNEYLNLTKHSKIMFIDRINVNWGTYSQIQAELNLLKKAITQNYSYYHLLSGKDLPLKNCEYIYKFFESNNGKEFLHFDSDIINDLIYERLKYFYSNKPNNILSSSLTKFQKLIHINRIKHSNTTFYKGANWFSITDKFANYVISKENIIKRIFSHSLCCDEIFMQTTLMNSTFNKNLYNNEFNNNYISIMRYIDWKRGNPYIFTNNDYDDLINSEFLFARKFSVLKDQKVIDRIFNHLNNNIITLQ